MCFTEKLIELVKTRSLLYDNTHGDYKNRKKKAAAWQEIAKEMGNSNGEYWSAKWKSLRDNYHKFKKHKETETGTLYKKYRNWPWSELMGFLDDFLCQRPEIPPHIRIKRSSLSNTDDTSPKNADDHTASSSKDPVRKKRDVEDSRLITDFKRKKRAPDSEPDTVPYTQTNSNNFDEVDLFFLSYAKNFKRLTPKCQALMKLEIASLFTKYELSDADCEKVLQSSRMFAFQNMSSVYSDSKCSNDNDDSNQS